MHELSFDLVIIAVPFVALFALIAFRRFCDDGVSQSHVEGLSYKNGNANWGAYAPVEQTRAKSHTAVRPSDKLLK